MRPSACLFWLIPGACLVWLIPGACLAWLLQGTWRFVCPTQLLQGPSFAWLIVTELFGLMDLLDQMGREVASCFSTKSPEFLEVL
jgi:hypothetical protein